MPRLEIALKALRELGPAQVGLYTWYQTQLRLGILRRQEVKEREERVSSLHFPVYTRPDPEALLQIIGPAGFNQAVSAAGEIAAGKVRLFGGEPQTLQLSPPGPLAHWTAYETGRVPWGVEDVKLIWEPARFGWAILLARAYLLTKDERYPAAFWEYLEEFLNANPINMGPNWASAQEVGLRLIALVFVGQIFQSSSHTHTERLALLSHAVAAHARRIPPTLSYAIAQHNNHLISEAAALYTASLALPEHPESTAWRKLGWRWFNHAIQTQFTAEGVYAQHSTSYHRLALQLSLWVHLLARAQGDSLPPAVQSKLCAAAGWLLALLDHETGEVPNLGPNDSAYIFPLAPCGYADYRPVIQSASAAFQGELALLPGPWDEMRLWLAPDQPLKEQTVRAASRSARRRGESGPLTLRGPHTWGYLRAAHFNSRPGHADQLHLDLWWRGQNVALDPGTYLYNASSPWDNSLSKTNVHNTVTVRGQDQMTRAGRFLYLDWAQGQVTACESNAAGKMECVTAQHDGYRRLGVLHQRAVRRQGDRWQIIDSLLPLPGKDRLVTLIPAQLHWLLPDWEWKVVSAEEPFILHLISPQGPIILTIDAGASFAQFQIARAGERLFGKEAVEPAWGWYSPIYGVKVPALSLHCFVDGTLPHVLTTDWQFPSEQEG